MKLNFAVISSDVILFLNVSLGFGILLSLPFIQKKGSVLYQATSFILVNCHEAKDFVASWDYTLMSISLPS